MCAASPALKSFVHFDRALRIAVSASPAGCADTAVAAAISKNPHQAERRFTLSGRPGRLLPTSAAAQERRSS
jgi:hypothetical protein